MKRTFLIGGIFLSFLVSFTSCRQNEEHIIQQEVYSKSVENFRQSNAYKRNLGFIEKKGQLVLNEATTEILTYNNVNFEVLQIPIYKNGIKVSKVEVIKMPNTKVLPFNDEYAINLIDFENFNKITKEGIIKMYDLNYDNEMHTVINISKDKISKKSVGISETVLAKYSPIRVQNEVLTKNPDKEKKQPHFCDSNKNGDISFGECYKCFSDAIDASGMSKAICDWTSTCTGTVTAACVYISAMN